MKKVLAIGIVPFVIILGIVIGVALFSFSKSQEKEENHEENIVINIIEDFNEINGYSYVLRENHVCDCVYSKHMGYSLPSDLEMHLDYGNYIQDSEGKYSILHDIGYEFVGDANRKVTILFSEISEPFGNYSYKSEDKVSIIYGYEMILRKYQEYYFVDFQYQNLFYHIETVSLSFEELLALLEGIIYE